MGGCLTKVAAPRKHLFIKKTMFKNTLIAGALFVGAIFALYGNEVLIEQQQYKVDIQKETMWSLGIGTKN